MIIKNNKIIKTWTKFIFHNRNLEKNRILINSFYGRVVPYEEISKSYMTISANGVIKYSPGEMTFTPIEIWEREYIDYLKLMKVNKKKFTLLHFFLHSHNVNIIFFILVQNFFKFSNLESLLRLEKVNLMEKI